MESIHLFLPDLVMGWHLMEVIDPLMLVLIQHQCSCHHLFRGWATMGFVPIGSTNVLLAGHSEWMESLHVSLSRQLLFLPCYTKHFCACASKHIVSACVDNVRDEHASYYVDVVCQFVPFVVPDYGCLLSVG